jgi:hypothetical protein
VEDRAFIRDTLDPERVRRDAENADTDPLERS